MKIDRTFFNGSLAIFVAQLVTFSSIAAGNETPNDFPFNLQFELGAAEFAPGDNITIKKLRGTSNTIKAGESYCVEGTYTLTSKPEAELAFFATLLNPNPTPIEKKQIAIVKKGSGSFRLEKTMTEDGYLHVSFYPAAGGNCFGGIYFGQGKWVLRQKGFSHFDQTSSPTAQEQPDSPSASDQVSLSGPNRTLFEYLGDPVDPPAQMDPRYTQSGLSNAVQSAARKAGITLKRVTIDDSEFPFLIGINCLDGDFPKLEEQLKKMEGYEYHGSVGWATRYAINIVPWAASPPGTGQRVSRRSTLRQSILCDKISSYR
ncbi:MAG TPA: hypothetical protein VEC99_17255 [Clostridia bacterium]|nr:hypothetical protein [Clostridia bacterium]